MSTPEIIARAEAARKRLKARAEARRRGDPEPEPKFVPKPIGGTYVFFHPDLGIGGAERLVVDAAVGIKKKGGKVVVYTNHCDPKHCFEECRDGTSQAASCKLSVS